MVFVRNIKIGAASTPATAAAIRRKPGRRVRWLVAWTIAHAVGVFVLWQQQIRLFGSIFLQKYSADNDNRANSSSSSSSLWRCNDDDDDDDNTKHGRNSSLLLIPGWNNHDTTSRDEIIQRSLEMYRRKSSNELDILRAIGVEGVLQILDPKGGRSWACLDAYFQNWKTTNNTAITTKQEEEDFTPLSSRAARSLFESFFAWLDNGEGRNVEIKTESGKDCHKKNKAFKRYLLFNETERAKTEITFDVDDHGRISNITFAYDGTTPDRGMHVFVWGRDRKIYMRHDQKREDNNNNNNNNTSWGHASFFSGQPVLYAGEMQIEHDSSRNNNNNNNNNNKTMAVVSWINDKSGNYKPSLSFMRNFYQFLRDVKGVNVTTTIQWKRGRDVLDDDWIYNLGINSTLRSRYGKRVD
jgi:hypothetical protein